jgi:polyisoprenoid-binding protein YceI
LSDATVKRYLLDSQRSRFSVQAFAVGLLGGVAHDPKFAIRQFDGEMRFAPESSADSSFVMTVKASSLELTGSVKERDRAEIQKTVMDEVLEANRYPEISFHSTEMAIDRVAENWYRAQIQGQMRLHGITNPLSIDSQLRLADRELRLTGEFVLLFADYRIKKVSGLGGLIKIKDELKFQFDLVGHEQNQE